MPLLKTVEYSRYKEAFWVSWNYLQVRFLPLVFPAVFLHVIQCKRQKLPQYLPLMAECIAT